MSSKTSTNDLPAPTGPTLSYDELIDTLLEFLEVAIHHVLFVRKVYPAEVFERRRKFNLPVNVSRYPKLNDYIRNILMGIKPDLHKNSVKKLYIAIQKNHQTLEKFTFEIRGLLERFDEDIRRKQQTTLTTTDIQSHLRGFLTKLSVSDSTLAPNPPDCTFTLLVEMSDDNNIPSAYSDQPEWIPAEPAPVPAPAIVPLKSMNAGVLKLQMFVEESQAKYSAHNKD
ncbi:DNA-binding protein [Gaertneriomyces semiglobifer]|nr:DNA-binding protein [Gaertneriomyces semiglobifer]